jgi:hypothetical protein
MIVTPVEEIAGVYLVDQVYNPELLDQFLAEDLSHIPVKSLPMQERWSTRKNYRMFPKTSCWQQLQNSVDYTPINNMGYHKQRELDTTYWIDLPGFNMGIHRDNPEVVVSMQVYLDTAEGLGTQFFSEDWRLLLAVPYVKNTGYLLVNKGQLHGFPRPVTQTRHSTYTWLKPNS